MPTHAVFRARANRLILALGVAALVAFALPALAAAKPQPKPPVLTFRTAAVGAPGNPSVAIVPFEDGIYGSCAEAPVVEKKPCQEVGSVAYPYGIGQLEVTVSQWVAFLNTVNPEGGNRSHLYSHTESGSAWPRFGQIDYSRRAAPGHHYSLAAKEWADKPYGFANFLRAARFINSLDNGKVLSHATSTENGFAYTTYRVRLSPETETGMYDMSKRAPVRTGKNGFVLPSQDEWIKAAYYDPKGGGTHSYWKYPTNPGTVGAGEADAPTESQLDPTNGDVTNSATQPLATFHNPKSASPPPSWCPSNRTASECATVNPFGLPPEKYEKAFAGSLGTVGQARTLGLWGTLDMGGNAVEWTDTITQPPFGIKGHRVWRRLHGGIANAPAYQLWLSAIGLQPQDNTFYTAIYPWLGFRIGTVGAVGGGR
jgi:formylglycine-generating enzyme required for sulfatase activity